MSGCPNVRLSGRQLYDCCGRTYPDTARAVCSRYIARQTGYILRTHPRRSIIIADRQGIVQYV